MGERERSRKDNKRKVDTMSRRDSLESENMIIGRHPVKEALRSGLPIDTVWISSTARGLYELIQLAKEQGCLVKTVTDQKLCQYAPNAVHQGVIAIASTVEYVSIADLLAIAEEKGHKPFLILCDEIEDPHNLGAIIRTAETAGADGVIIPKRRSASLSPTVHKTSAGAASWVPIARVSNLGSAIDELKQAGVWIYGTDIAGEPYASTDLTGAVALVIGSEGRGMSRLVREKCDFLLKLPMHGKISSLNASVSAGIFMYEVIRQRG